MERLKGCYLEAYGNSFGDLHSSMERLKAATASMLPAPFVLFTFQYGEIKSRRRHAEGE